MPWNMEEPLTIGRLAGEANVPTSTVRFYERRGLLSPKSRSPHGYRRYDQTSVRRLRFIRAAQDSGFSLDDIARLLALRDHPDEDCQDVQQIIGDRLAVIGDQIARLRRVEAVLDDALTECRTCSVAQGCQTLDRLDCEADSQTPSCRKRSCQ